MRINNTLIAAALIVGANAAPIITTTVTAATETNWVTVTENTVYTTNVKIVTANGPPPANTPGTTEAAQTTQSTTEVTPTTTSTTEAAPTTPSTTEAAPTTTSTTEAAPTTTSTTESAPTTPSTTEAAPTTTSTTEVAPTTIPTEAATTSTPTTTTTSSTSASATTSSALSSFDAQILQEHNIKRALHGVQDLSWDPVLAEYATNYAATLFSCDNVQLIHSGGPYGENLAAGYVGGASPVDAWYDEISQYNFSDPGFSEATGHFTQVVWKGTSTLGCAMVTCDNEWRQYTICEYSDQRGNIVGTDPATGESYFQENVVPPLN